MSSIDKTVQGLLDRGVVMPAPQAVYVGPEVDPEWIAPGVRIHPGCRLTGTRTSIGPGCVLGEEGPVTLIDTQLADGVVLKGGSFRECVLLSQVEIGPCAHVRTGSLLEEHVCGGHAVGFKQTILMPFTMTGSLVNVCDCLMAGGTGPDDYGEIGSCFVHFNNTPRREKATASLFGDVPHGVLLNQRPIFLGGQGGAVGPLRVAYGTTVAAGTILRRDVSEPGLLVFGDAPRRRQSRALGASSFRTVAHVVRRNVDYIGHLLALHQWYAVVRTPLASSEPFTLRCVVEAQALLCRAVAERLYWLRVLADRVAALRSPHRADSLSGLAAWVETADELEAFNPEFDPAPELCDPSVASLAQASAGTPYVDVIRGLDGAVGESVVRWLQARVDAVSETFDLEI